MKKYPNWVKGFIRLSVILYVIIWLGLSAWHIKEELDDFWVLGSHISPYLAEGFEPSSNDWCVIIASKDFLSKPEYDRVIIAEHFYTTRIEHLTKRFYIDSQKYKKWFLNTATLTLPQAPINNFMRISGARVELGIKYRRIPLTDLPTPQWYKAFFEPAIFLGSLLILITIIALILLIFFTVRWVVRGFKNT